MNREHLTGFSAAEVLLGICMNYPCPGIVERIGPDWDWIWIDGQHGEFGYTDMINMVRACDLVGKPAFVRVAGHEYGLIGRALDCAPAGIIVPCVDTVEQAKAVVDAAKFPPIGKRSYGGRRPIDLGGRGYWNDPDNRIQLICQIESPEAVEAADRIAAVDGVDGLLLGPDDLMLRKGHDMTSKRDEDALSDSMRRVASACEREGRIAVIVGSDAEMVQRCVSLGYTMIAGSSDSRLLAESSADAASRTRRSIAVAADGRARDAARRSTRS